LNKAKGQYFFSADTMRFFHSRVGQTAYAINGIAYFISSEQREHDIPRKYTIRKANLETGDIGTVGEFQAYDSNAQAMSALKKLYSEQEKLVLVEQKS
jgi:hypothetical protein